MVIYVNSFVHTVMYSYYLVTSLWPEYKEKLWWKKYITQLQLVINRHILLQLSSVIFSYV
jgi:hypothetical protein